MPREQVHGGPLRATKKAASLIEMESMLALFLALEPQGMVGRFVVRLRTRAARPLACCAPLSTSSAPAAMALPLHLSPPLDRRVHSPLPVRRWETPFMVLFEFRTRVPLGGLGGGSAGASSRVG